jgi:flagellar M-ring protein FliF
VNFQRALEGELASSIQTLHAVQAARVHLALPRETVFVRDRQPPTASVLLSLAGIVQCAQPQCGQCIGGGPGWQPAVVPTRRCRP